MKNVSYIGGTFDLFHSGHINILKETKKISDYVVLALNSDEFCISYKRKPVMKEYERLDLIRSCKYVDMSFIVESWDQQKKYIEMIKPNFIIHGDDWEKTSLIEQLGLTEEFMLENKIELKYVKYTDGISTSDIINRIKKYDL